MSATLGINKFQVERIGETVTVPSSPLAKLMYYISCIFTVIQYDGDQKLTDYKNYYYLNEEEKKVVYQLAILFDPKIFINAGIFILNSGLLPPNSGNEFFKITDERIGVHVSQEIMIGGSSIKVLKLMACDTSWLERNYYNPLRQILNQQSYGTNTVSQYVSSRNEYNTQTTRIIVNQTSPTYYYSSKQTSQRNGEFNYCKCIVYTLLCIYCGPIFWIYLCFCRDEDLC